MEIKKHAVQWRLQMGIDEHYERGKPAPLTGNYSSVNDLHDGTGKSHIE